MPSASVILFQLLTSVLFFNFWWNGFKVTITLNICASIATAMGPNVNRHLRILGAGIFSTLADAKVLHLFNLISSNLLGSLVETSGVC